jgi:hypothetical protein
MLLSRFLFRAPGGTDPRQRADDTVLPADGVLGALRVAALAATGLLVTASTLVAFAESYRGLYEWAGGHGLSGFWAAVWPLQVDIFVAVGELTLFAALVGEWPARARVMPWAVTLGGLAVSVAGNVGHVAGHSVANHATAAVPPVAASAAMAVGLAALKRVVRARAVPARAAAGQAVPAQPAVPAAAAAAGRRGAPPGRRAARARAARNGPTAADVARHFETEIAAGQMPSQRAIRAKWRVGSDRARELLDELEGIPAGRPAAPADLFSEDVLTAAP